MKLTIVKRAGGSCTFAKFIEDNGLEVEVRERSVKVLLPRWYALIKDVDVYEDGLLIGVSGNGNSISEAVDDLANRTAGSTLAIGIGHLSNRRMIDTPNEWLLPNTIVRGKEVKCIRQG